MGRPSTTPPGHPGKHKRASGLASLSTWVPVDLKARVDALHGRGKKFKHQKDALIAIIEAGLAACSGGDDGS